MDTQIPQDLIVAGNNLSRVVLAVASGAQSTTDIQRMTGIRSRATILGWARTAVRLGFIRDIADEAGKPRNNSYRPSLHIVQLAQEFRTDAVS